MIKWLLGTLLVLGVAGLIAYVRQNKTATEAEARPKLGTQDEFHAVAIQYSVNACDAAKAMTGRRFLATEAPQLPLKECDFDDCRCTFTHYSDRRSKTGRRTPFAHQGQTETTGTYEREKRKIADRRKNTKS
jgi:hypothetical protein